MIMPRGQLLLLPSSKKFIWLSILVAWLLQMGIAFFSWDASLALPNLLILVLMFWAIREPNQIGFSIMFIFGLLQDVQQTQLFGYNALYCSLLCLGATTLSRRLLLFGPLWQAIQLFPVFLISQIIALAIRCVLTWKGFPGWDIFLSPILNTLLWPFISVLLILPQHRAPDPDAVRPL